MKIYTCAVLIGLLFFALALPVSAFAATLSLSPSNGTFNKSCNFSLNVVLDTAGVQTDGTDAYILYDNSRVTALSMTPGTIYADYPGNNIDDPSGKVTISGLAALSSAFSGQGTLATVNFLVKETAPTGATQIKFDFDPTGKSAQAACMTSGVNSCDSNVLQRDVAQDVLSSVVNGNYTIGTGACGAIQASPTPGAGQVSQGGTGGTFESTPAPQPKQFKTIDQAAGGSPGGGTELTFALTIVGAALTILGILGLALL